MDIKKDSIIRKIKKLGGKGGKREKLTVDWFRTVGVKNGEDLWYLRIRSYDNKKHEVTWKSKSKILGNVRKHKEINFLLDEPKKLADLFSEIDLEIMPIKKNIEHLLFLKIGGLILMSIQKCQPLLRLRVRAKSM